MKKMFLAVMIKAFVLTGRLLLFQNKICMRFYNIIYDYIYDLFCAFWLGIFEKETLNLLSDYHHDKSEYSWKEWNKGGLFIWEKEAIEKYFKNCKSILVTSIGGGREVLALRYLGYDADGFDCNAKLVECANELLYKEGFNPNIKLVPKDICPALSRKYDGVIIGWGSYELIKGRKHRISFLKEIRFNMNEKSPILLSFFYVKPKHKRSISRLKRIAKMGNIIKSILKREHLEVGDSLHAEKPKLFFNFVHYFSKQQITSELREGGFELVYFNDRPYAHTVGIAMPQGEMKT